MIVSCDEKDSAGEAASTGIACSTGSPLIDTITFEPPIAATVMRAEVSRRTFNIVFKKVTVTKPNIKVWEPNILLLQGASLSTDLVQ